mgnify:CR=1 FL=1
MVERFFARRSTVDRMRSGPLGPYVDEFAQWLAEQGYTRDITSRKIRLVADLSRWLARRRMDATDLNEQRLESFLRQRRRILPHYCGERPALHQFLAQLRTLGVTPGPSPDAEHTELHRVLTTYTQYLVQERALSPMTVKQQVAYIRRFLCERFGTTQVHCEALGPADIAAHLLQHNNTASPRGPQAIATALRTFLRFLYVRGVVGNNLAGAVPRMAHWHLAGVPKFLTAEQVESLLRGCDLGTALGRRDHAVLLLLARLGLRACELIRMELDDIDWTTGELTVRGKAGQQDRLPLPADIGEALAAYLHYDRPRCANRHLFVRMNAPHRGFRSSMAIHYIVSKALERANLNPAHKGARLLRQSLATNMLGHGATLSQIGEVLRHRSQDSTELYAKVDVNRLRALARPWPGAEA